MVAFVLDFLKQVLEFDVKLFAQITLYTLYFSLDIFLHDSRLSGFRFCGFLQLPELLLITIE